MLGRRSLDSVPHQVVDRWIQAKAAVALDEAKGVEKIRVVAIVNGVTVGAVDMTLDRNRLDLACENGLVVLAFFPTNRHAGVWPGQPESE